MRGTALALQQIWGSQRTQLYIPVYQRNYAWKIENCNQLFADLVKLKESSRETHFFGSIVTAPAGSGLDRLIIDGQQRLTTTSLLLLAAIKAVKDMKLAINDEVLTEEAYENILWAKYGYNPTSKVKLLPIEQDRVAYERLFTWDEAQFVSDSKITRNFKYFYDRLTATPAPFTFDELYNVIDRLQIISIDLDEKDDPQLIFESLNSTGLALEESDKIRNYLLMSLSATDQEQCFKEYWQKIYTATHEAPTMFLRDYITISDNLLRPVRISDLYFHWKRYMEQRHRDRKEELASMLVCAHYYRMINDAEVCFSVNGTQAGSEKLSKKMRQLRTLDTDVINVFLISFLKYANETEMTEAEIHDVLDLVENYLARRVVCSLPSNSLTQTFCVLHRDVLRSFEEYANVGQTLEKTYADVLTYHILRREGNFRIPRDAAFKEAILTRNVYQMPKAPQTFLLERLENFSHKEQIDVPRLLSSGEASIEHIMPQTLTPQWREMLGENANEIHEKYLHTFANLTLTGVNSELSNHPFEDKKNGREVDGVWVNGYRNSIYRLTQELMPHETWNEQDLLKRAERIEKKLISLYPMPTTTYQPLPKPVEDVSLEDESFNPTNRWLQGYRLFGHEIKQTYWVEMFSDVVKALLERYPDGVYALCEADRFLHTSAPEGDKAYRKLADNCYLWVLSRNTTKLSMLRHFFDELDIPQSELILLLNPEKQEANPISHE